jgi:2-polyprenyl-3-methyl-5-hydroxy-6-metoxy-1,4-benzoquinol methylase
MHCTPKLAAPDRFNLKSEIRYHIVACAQCEFVFLNPRPKSDASAEIYKAAAYQPFLSTQPQRSFGDRIYRLARRVNVRSKRRKIEKLKARGKILDVGCGTGEFLFEMKRHGWETIGIETSARAAGFARKNYGLEIAAADLVEADFAAEQFDVITFWHVLEHVHDPLATLKIARQILSDDGVILIACPNIESVDARFYGSNWVALDAPRHLSHFTPAALARAAQEADLELFRFGPMMLDTIYNCLMSEPIVAAGTRGKIFNLLFGLRALLIAGAALLVAAIASRRGSAILYFLRKRVKNEAP